MGVILEIYELFVVIIYPSDPPSLRGLDYTMKKKREKEEKMKERKEREDSSQDETDGEEEDKKGLVSTNLLYILVLTATMEYSS